ncbi:hypothetical protein L9F63_002270 [Diploptera punctata]|uniref:LisH domain-containing protein ARMC9 n=1 Tax=Diploptera punctata TaxID=6984 RepID=A0AAD8A295_DIPPU|nr:hypothetical protein L9F63_002270 [Diploptera punctata]
MGDSVNGDKQENYKENTSHNEKLLPSDVTKYNEAEKFSLRLINEFLQSYELEKTLAAFMEECTNLGFEVPTVLKKDRIKQESVVKILEYFADKDLKKFFNAWENLVPSSIQEKIEYKKLTFYLHVHFAVLPLRKSDKNKVSNEIETKSEKDAEPLEGDQSEKEDKNDVEEPVDKRKDVQENEDGIHGMEDLRNFLETKGTEFSGEPEFLPFYALPFVSEPAKHPSFQELFTVSGTYRLADNLRDFLIEHSWGSTVAPQLLQLGLVHRCSTAQKSHAQLLETHKHFKLLKRRYQKLHKDHHNLIGIAAELTGALESSVKGQAVDLKATLNNCTKIFPDLFAHAVGSESHAEAPPEEIIRRSIQQTREDHTGSGFDLDFRKIKQHLASGSVKTKLLLFQALRWRITRSSSEDRDNVVGSYFRHDLLSLHHSNLQCSQLPLLEHFCPAHAATPHPLQQVAARLVNTLASLRCGRDYLCSSGCDVLRVLVPCLRGDRGIKIDSITADMILATLQKLSLRRNQRIGMIEVGLVEWLIQRLSADAITMKAYTLEYSTALLMNLCLHRRAKERCVPLAKTVLKLLTALLGTEITQAVPYVNGTLYSLLAHPQLNHEAKRMGLCSVLEYYLKHSEGEMSKQLEYILKLHRGDCQPDHSATSDEENADDDAEEVDLLEEELDNDDPVRSLHGELCGDQLLYQQYRLVFPYHGIVHPTSSSTSQSVGDLLMRPTTPRLLSFGSLEGKCPSAVDCSAVRPATSPDLNTQSKDEDDQTDTCSRNCDVLFLESVDKEEEDEEDGLVCEEVKQEPESETVPDVQTSQPSATSEDGEDEYSKAFTSRPKIPRTPTFKNK